MFSPESEDQLAQLYWYIASAGSPNKGTLTQPIRCSTTLVTQRQHAAEALRPLTATLLCHASRPNRGVRNSQPSSVARRLRGQRFLIVALTSSRTYLR